MLYKLNSLGVNAERISFDVGGDHPFRMAALKVYPCIAHVTSPLAQRYSLKRMSSSLMRDESDVSGRAITDGSAGPMPVLPLAALGVALFNTLRRVTNSPYALIVLLHRIFYCIFICAVTPEGVFFFLQVNVKVSRRHMWKRGKRRP